MLKKELRLCQWRINSCDVQENFSRHSEKVEMRMTLMVFVCLFVCTRVNLNYRSKNSIDSYTQSSKATSTYHAVLYTWLLDTQTPWGLVLKQHDRDITHSTCSPDDVWPSRSAWYARAPTGREPGGRVGGRGSTLRVFSDKTDRSKIFF